MNSSAAVASGVACWSLDRKLRALNAPTGLQLWGFQTRGPVICSSAVMNGVDADSQYGNLYALNASTGTKL